MNRQFLITLMLFLLIVTGYNQFVALPRARAAQQAAEEQLKAKQAQEAAAAPARLYQEKPAPKPEELISLSLPQADITFSSKGAGIKTYLFQDDLGPVDLTPYQGVGYFATLQDVDFAETSRTQNSITFAGEVLKGVQVVKTYTFNENGIFP